METKYKASIYVINGHGMQQDAFFKYNVFPVECNYLKIKNFLLKTLMCRFQSCKKEKEKKRGKT